ncbi:MAG: NAD(+)/NADH kinase [Bryobacteraceae bacterium]
MPNKIDTVGVISKPGSDLAVRVVPEVIAWLEARGMSVRLDPETAGYAKRDAVPRESVADGAQLVIVLGGDGTLLSAARAVGGRDIPLFAVNLGNLGFLTAIKVDEIYPQLERVLKGEFQTGHRRMLHSELWRGGQCIGTYEALNDMTLAKSEIARMIDFSVDVDDHQMCLYKADGLVISTPTGSTAYSLSAGGPVVFPTVAALCITPICPHSLTQRPVIVPDEAIIRINVVGASQTYLTADGQVGQLLQPGDQVICRRSEKTVALIHQPDQKFFDVLREKLKWGGR